MVAIDDGHVSVEKFGCFWVDNIFNLQKIFKAKRMKEVKY